MKTDRLPIPRNLVLIICLMTGCFALMAATSRSAGDTGGIPYPEGYRNWSHVRTMLFKKGNQANAHWGEFHHIYGNAKAIEGYKIGKFNDGSIIVLDILDAIATDSLIIEGKRKVVDVMVKDAEKFKTTGGWGYQAFSADNKTEGNVTALSATACHNCHTQRKDNDNVFSKLRN